MFAKMFATVSTTGSLETIVTLCYVSVRHDVTWSRDIVVIGCWRCSLL